MRTFSFLFLFWSVVEYCHCRYFTIGKCLSIVVYFEYEEYRGFRQRAKCVMIEGRGREDGGWALITTVAIPHVTRSALKIQTTCNSLWKHLVSCVALRNTWENTHLRTHTRLLMTRDVGLSILLLRMCRLDRFLFFFPCFFSPRWLDSFVFPKPMPFFSGFFSLFFWNAQHFSCLELIFQEMVNVRSRRCEEQGCSKQSRSEECEDCRGDFSSINSVFC